MKTVLHRAETRGSANFGWLDSKHTFSFGRYYNPERVNFGALRVLNDDIVTGGAGFGTHPHDNMEIVSIPLRGDLKHEDSTGRGEIIKTGDVQIMSAGSGLQHSEFNPNKDKEVNFLQIWVLPKEHNITPRYDQKSFDVSNRKNSIQTVVSPTDEQAVWINQDAYFSLSDLSKGSSVEYKMNHSGNGVYVFVLEGEVTVAETSLTRRDGLGVWDTDEVSITASADAQLLFIEVPMLKLAG
ncbi:MAG: pirin family protein [Cyclobacteriaceae bacterium]